MKPLGADRWFPVACFLCLMERVQAVIHEGVSPGSEVQCRCLLKSAEEGNEQAFGILKE